MFFEIFITVLLVLLNGFFVAAEFSIVKVRASQLEIKLAQGNRFAKLTRHIVSHLDGYLAATQLGITLASLALGWIGEPVVSVIIIKIMHLIGVSVSPELAHNIALPIAFAIISILHIVFGELAPKSIAIQRSEKTALSIAYPLQFFYMIFRPFIWMLNGIANVLLKIIGISPVHGSEVHSSEELKYLVKEQKESGLIPEADYKIIRNAFDFSDRTTRQVMVPRTEVVAIDVNNFTEAVLEKLIEEGYSRIPCYENTLDNVLGVAYLKDLLLKNRTGEPIVIRELMRPVMVVLSSQTLGPLLKKFQLKHQQLAVVVDEYGGTKGIVTMEDILEEIVGEIQDEYDNEIPFVEKTGDISYTVLASTSLDNINDLLPHPISKADTYETLSGKLVHEFGHIPNTNDNIIFDNYEITVLKKSKNAVVLVRLRDLGE
ncbi:MAG: hemolysin family protein [Bacteroidota bacterium]